MTSQADGGSQPMIIPIDHIVDPERVPDEPLRPPFSQRGLLDVFRRRYLLKLLVAKEIQARYQGSLLGLTWSYIQPAVRFAMYFFVIGIVLGVHKSVPNFAIHLFAALVFVNYFTETFQAGTRSIIRNKSLVQKMAMPREMFPVASMIVSAIHTFPQFVILLVASATQGYHPSISSLLAFLLGATILALFATGLALLFSAMNVFFRDFENIVSTMMIFTHWAVPMIYPWSRVGGTDAIPDWVKEVYLANPLAEAVLLIQKAFWVPTCRSEVACSGPGAMPGHLFERGAVMVVAGVLFLWFAQVAFTRLESRFAERLN